MILLMEKKIRSPHPISAPFLNIWNNISLPYLLTKDTMHAYVSHILRKGGGGTEKGEGIWFFFSPKVPQIRHQLFSAIFRRPSRDINNSFIDLQILGLCSSNLIPLPCEYFNEEMILLIVLCCMKWSCFFWKTKMVKMIVTKFKKLLNNLTLKPCISFIFLKNKIHFYFKLKNEKKNQQRKVSLFIIFFI